jgi:hypothetical protein
MVLQRLLASYYQGAIYRQRKKQMFYPPTPCAEEKRFGPMGRYSLQSKD